MTSQLNVDTIVDKAGSGGTNVKIGNTSTYVSDGGAVTQNAVQGAIKQFINIPADGASISDSFNVSSLDDDGTGDRGIHMTNNFGNITYMVLSGFEDTGEGSQYIMGDVTQGTITTSAYDFEGIRGRSDINRTNRDNLTYLAVVGDLA